MCSPFPRAAWLGPVFPRRPRCDGFCQPQELTGVLKAGPSWSEAPPGGVGQQLPGDTGPCFRSFQALEVITPRRRRFLLKPAAASSPWSPDWHALQEAGLATADRCRDTASHRPHLRGASWAPRKPWGQAVAVECPPRAGCSGGSHVPRGRGPPRGRRRLQRRLFGVYATKV